jgi:hypothetical protein
VDESPVSIRTLPGFTFDPSIVTSLIINNDNEDREEYNQKKAMTEKNKNSHVLNVISSNRMKQLSLDQFMKK